MGAIIKALRVLNEDLDNSKKVPLNEKVKLYKLIEDNEPIINFLSQEKQEKKQENTIEITFNEEEVGEEEYDNILVRDEHPKNLLH